MSNYVIKEITDNELVKAAAVIREGFQTVAIQFGLTFENCATNGAFIEKERLIIDKAKGSYMYGLYHEDEMIGFMQLEKKNELQYEIDRLTILPPYRNQGLGKNMVDYAKRLVKELGGRKIIIGMIEENIKLKNWYEVNGFIHLGTKKFDFLPFTVGYMEAYF